MMTVIITLRVKRRYFKHSLLQTVSFNFYLKLCISIHAETNTARKIVLRMGPTKLCAVELCFADKFQERGFQSKVCSCHTITCVSI